ncbi:sodium:proton antiporter [[Clostridium] leptum DSM 753]|uniref:Sodium:proton antiporter n=2 Tax=[Clostridium] leptum TaxID=1535 RepID=A0A855A114_9FIRM|nr:sodium:proton antiporter [[Clostridium] leptum DSM 753]RGU00591.1 Na+/H+ antiporter NhaC family protein [[Clostridium] leptum]
MGVWLNDFYAMPAIVGFLIALGVAFCQNRKRSFSEKMEDVTHSMGDSNVMIMCLVFVMAGGFSGAVQAAGGVDSTVNFSLSILPPSVAVAGLFIIGCFISTAMGTSVGTIAALAPIAVGISDKTGIAGALCIGAVVSGAMFGDNLSMISDTTIAATRTQGCEMKDKFRENFKIVLPAAVISLVLFLILASGGDYTFTGDRSYNLFKILPYLVVLIGALLGMNVFVVLALGIVLSLVVGVATGAFAWTDMFRVVFEGPDGAGGIKNMYDITVISIVVAGIIGLVKANGGIDFILNGIKKRVKTPKGAQLGIAALSSLVDISTANNTVAIVMAGPIAKDISNEFSISPKRTAAILDIFTSVWQGIIPYGAQILYACAGAAAVGMTLSPVELFPYLFYPILMGISAVVFILFFGNRKKSKN